MTEDNITITTITAAATSTKSILAPKRLTSLATPFLELVQNLDNAINKQDYNKVIKYTTLGIDQLLSKQRQSDLAIADAHRMIGHSLMSVDGYLRKANVFSMYGRQLQAIEAYDEGLQNVAPGEDQEVYIRQLEQERMVARKRNNNHIDFITKLPADIVNVVIILVFSTTCFQFMQDGYFSKMKSFEIKGLGDTSHQLGPLNTTIIIGFWKIRQTLTTLDLDVGDNVDSVKVVDLLLTCTNLIKLKFTTLHPLNRLIGDFSTMKQHRALIDLQIKSKDIIGSDIILLLQRCQELRRLVMNTCHESVLDVINRYTPNLEILANNPQSDIEQLHENGSGNGKGLKSFYIDNGSLPVSINSVLPVMYKNKTTLQTLDVHISQISQVNLQNLYITYPDFTLDNITHLTFWSYAGIQELILQSIRKTTTLTHLHAMKMHHMNGLIEPLLIMPPLLTLKLWYSYTVTMDNRSSLIRLFELYARAAKKSHLSLKHVDFRYCVTIPDEILSALAAINTLHEITLCGLNSITTNGINSMISKLNDQLTYVCLKDMSFITDDIIITLGDLKQLEYLELSVLNHVTDKSIYELLNKVDPLILTKLVITYCAKVTKACIAYAKQKLKIVEDI
ncbi:hypothetical protein INT45_004856 [Circinella minor]|uniref:Uncharacterized protein n=1 Tax=Circinella minor TaxID=1195481 RepID=A0A8H7VGG4_9FUNG|nr:hypothetical protein INT45_004856 [Circinella minor]